MEKCEIIKTYARHEGDTGSPEVQIALLSRLLIALHLPRAAADTQQCRRTQQRQQGAHKPFLHSSILSAERTKVTDQSAADIRSGGSILLLYVIVP